MKKLLVLLLITLSSVAMAEGTERRVVKDSTGYRIVKEQPKDVGITVEAEDLRLSSDQLAQIIDEKKRIPLDVQKKNLRWDMYLMHIQYEKVSTVQAELEGTVIKKVRETVTGERATAFNPSFISSLIYILCYGHCIQVDKE